MLGLLLVLRHCYIYPTLARLASWSHLKLCSAALYSDAQVHSAFHSAAWLVWSAGQAPITWADLIVIAAKVTTVLEWADIKTRRNPAAEGGVSIASLFGAQWQLQLGRPEASEPDAEVQIPTIDSSVDEIRVRPDAPVYVLALQAKHSVLSLML